MQIWWLPIAPQVDTMVVLAGVLTVGFSLKPNILFNAPIKALTLQTTISIPAPIPLAQKQSRFYVQWIWILNNQICQIKRKTYIYGWVHVTFNVILSNIISFNIFFDICIAKFQDGHKSITISTIKRLNFKCLYFKIMHKYEFMNWIVNNIWLKQNLALVLKI